MINFLGIGTQRAGTTTIGEILGCHESIEFLQDEINFFSKGIYSFPIDAYFSKWKSKDKLRGEKSPSYCLMRDFEIKRMKKLLPDVKLILLLRNPVDRMYSGLNRHYTFSYLERKNEKESESATMNFITSKINVEFGMYGRIVTKYKKYFPDQLYIGFYESMVADVDPVVRDISEFLGVDVKQDNIPEVQRNISKKKAHLHPKFRFFLSKLYLNDLLLLRKYVDNPIVDQWITEARICIAANKKYYAVYLYLYYFRYLPPVVLKNVFEPFRTLYKNTSYYLLNTIKN